MDKQHGFYKLTPTNDTEMGVYDKAMEYVFANKDIRNIAISGSYGAGKSSMIESYKKAHQEKKFIHISLAHFISEEDKNAEEADRRVDRKDNKKENREIALEGKIINQLIHQIEPQNIPLTNFRIKKDVDTKRILKIALFITAFIAITCFLRFQNAWKSMVNTFSVGILRELFYFTTTSEMEFLMGIAALVLLGAAIYEVIRLQKSARLFKKLIFKGSEIEIFEESKDSFFDKYLNEVLYIFKHADADGIIFEDIDRYDTNVIFEKLREINFLLNQKDVANNEKEPEQVIRFFYLLRDDIFESKDRTKFFDFILPIVPVVDASNAYDKFIEYFKNANLLELFDMDLVKELSLYVDDMRVLKNICNEFIIYHERLKTSFSEQSNSKLLAMIVYKNIFPKDFSNLQVGRGYIYTLFAEKKSFVRDKVEQCKKEIKVLQEENEKIRAEMCDDLDELNALYFLIDGRIFVDGKEETEYCTRKEFVKAILTSNNIERYGYGRNISIENEKKTMEQNPEYIERKALIEKKSKGKISTNNLHIAQLNRQMGELEYANLKDIITSENETTVFMTNYKNTLDEVEEFAEVKRSPYFDLIKMLIREGYLDETYSDYMTYFYENSITANDKAFIRSITDRHKKSFDYPLNNAALVVSRIRVIDFNKEEALNFELLEQLLSDVQKYNEQLQNFLEMIYNIEPVDFVSQFLERNIAREKFVGEFNVCWSGANKWILSEGGFSLSQKRQYVADTLCVSSEEVIRENNYEKEINEFVEGDPQFLSVHVADRDLLKKRLKLLGIRFRDINFETVNDGLLQYVYDNNMYQINSRMIQKMLTYRYDIKDGDNLLSRGLSIIFSKPKEPLCNYIKSNIDLYLFVMLTETRETDDIEEVVLYVLNSSDIAEENLRAYIASMKKPIPHLKNVKDAEWWSELLKQNKVQKTIENLCDYYFLSGNGLDDSLLAFINEFEGCPIIKPDYLDNAYGKDAAQKLFQDIIKGNEIANDKYEGMVCAFGMICVALPQDEIAPDKIEILINQRILDMNADTLVAVREYYPDKRLPFIIMNIEKYTKIMDRTMFSSSELMQLLEEEISDELKLRLLGFETNPISIRNKKYSAKVKEYILKNLYSSEDFSHLLKDYHSYKTSSREIILDKAIREIRRAGELPCVANIKLFEQLMQTDQIDNRDKQGLLIQQIRSGIDKRAMKVAFEQLGLTEYKGILEGQSGKISATSTNERMLNALLARRWIKGYKVEEEDPSLFHIYGKAAHTDESGGNRR